MTTVKILLVEDDPLFAIEAEMIVEELGFSLLHTVDNVADALAAVEREKPDLLLVDIMLKGEQNGIDLAFAIQDTRIPVIFLTANSSKLIYEAAKLALPHAMLVKPFDKLTLQSTIEAVLIRSGNQQATVEILRIWQEGMVVNENLFIKNNNKLLKVCIPEIRVIEAEGNYSMIFTENKKYVVKISLRQLLLKLSPRLFIQIHRNYIIQLPFVESIDLTSNTVMVAEKSFPIGGKYKNAFLRRLNRV